MPLKFLLDEQLRGPLWSEIQRHNVDGKDLIDAVRVGDSAELPLGSLDPEILRWAEREQRIVVSEDKNTLPGHFTAHLNAGHGSPGVFLIRAGCNIPSFLSFRSAAAHASEAYEWQDRMEWIP